MAHYGISKRLRDKRRTKRAQAFQLVLCRKAQGK